MTGIKRQISFSKCSDEQIKKLRRSICLEDLSNELFYEIFDYLDGCDIHKAFSNLNIRFENLLTNSFLPLKINLSSKSQSTLEQHCRHVIIPNKHRILSLHLNDPSVIRNFFDHCNIDSSFKRLESVILNRLSAYKLTTILFYLNCLPLLSALTIQLEEDSYYNLNDIYRLIFRLPYLKYNKLSVVDYEESEIFMPMTMNEKPSTIEYLIINLNCTVNELTSILRHTPHLQHLTCDGLVEPEDIDRKDMQLTLSKLTHISFLDCSIPFDRFEMFIKEISSPLQVLRLKTSNDTAYLDGNRWKRLIKKHMPLLYEFHFDHHDYTDSFEDVTPKHESINQFTSSFWTERYWFFELKDSLEEVVYSIHPYRKMWSDHHTDGQIVTCSNRTTDQYTIKSNNILCRQQAEKAFIQSIQLTIEGYTAPTWGPSYIDDMKSCFTAVQFTYLNIDCNGLPIDMLIEIIRLLPNLNSLKVSSFPLVQLNSLSTEDTEILLLVSITNKITKVKLDKMNGMDQIDFFMNLCPRMQYLEVECTPEYDLENIIGCISMNNIIRVPYLCSVCFCVPDANVKIIENLNKIIDFERLFHIDNRTFRDFVIQGIQNKIFFNWKL